MADSRLIMTDTHLVVLGLGSPQPSIKLGVSGISVLVCIDMYAPSIAGLWPSRW